MRHSTDEISELERALRWLLDDLCDKEGFCISSDATDAIARRSSFSADEFARAVLEAEGMNADYDRKSLRAVRERFAERFGEFVTTNDFEITHSCQRTRHLAGWGSDPQFE